MKRIAELLFFCCLLASVATLPAYAQVDYSTSTLQGVVYDPTGAIVPGARVTVTNPATGFTRTVSVNSDGSYVIPVLQPGNYQITVEASGFEKQVVQSFTLLVGTVSEYSVHMKMGSAATIVEVTGETAPVIQITQTQQADYISEVAEQNVPSVARDYSETIQLLPGMTNAEAVHTSGAQRNIGAFPVNNFTTAGGNGRGGLVTIDGGENDYGSGSSRVTHISPDAIQELQVNRNSFNAEFGFTLAEHVNVVTKSGGNQFHGNLFGLFRDQLTDAQPFFQIGTNHPIDQDYHVGGDLGGALIKDKLFFFLNTEAYRTTVDSLKNFNTPFLLGLNDMQTGDAGIAAAQRTYVAEVSAVSPALGAALGTALIPADNPVCGIVPGGCVNALIGGQSGLFPDDAQWFDSVARLDWTPTEKDIFAFRFLLERMDDPLALLGGADGYAAGAGPSTAASYATNDTTRDYEVLTTWSHIFSSSLVNTLRVQIVPENITDLTWDNGHGGPTSPFDAFTDGFGTFGPLLGSEVFTHQERYQFEDSVTWTKGKHSFKFGESFRPVRYIYFDNLYAHSQIAFVPGATPVVLAAGATSPLVAQLVGVNFFLQSSNPALPPGTFGSTTLANGQTLLCTAGVVATAPACLGPAAAGLTSLQAFAAGIPTQIRTSTGNNALLTYWADYGGVYFQDSWKVVPRLTVDYGLRFDVDDEDFPKTSAFKYVSPRLGFAYDMFGDYKTVLRAGAGIFVAPAQFQDSYYSNLYNPTGALGFAQAVETLGTPGYNALVGQLFGSGNFPGLGIITAANYTAAGIPIAQGNANGIGIINPPGGYKNNYGIQASMSIQRELDKNTSLEIGYNYQHTVRLQDPLEVGFVNNPNVPINPLLGPILMPNPANNPLIGGQPEFETLTEYCGCGSALYNALTASLTRRFADHLQFQANYTWSHAIDDVLDFSSFDSSYFPTIPGKDRATSPYNIGNLFTAQAVYTTPFSFNSGSFFTRALADITLAPIVTIHSGTPWEIFDSPPTGAAGNGLTQEALNQARPFNAPRDSGILPWNYRWDMKINKDFRLSRSREALRLGVSVTAANLLNHTNFTGVNGIFPAGNVAAAAATIFPNGGNLLDGPYNLRGVKALDFNGTIPGSTPLSFDSADIARQIQFGLRLSF
jgi:Carboxypeptidase regulatory-like domain